MLKQTVRELTATEQRALRLTLARCERDRRRLGIRSLGVAIGIFTILCGLTFLASDASPVVILPFWLVTALSVAGWTWIGEDRKSRQTIRRYTDALRHNRAEVVRVTSSVMAEFEEVEDEGACYVFELPADRLLFICGQEYYPSARFPNSDFSLVHIKDEVGNLVELFIEKHGEKLAPIRTIPASVKAKLRCPSHLEVVDGTIASVESCLAASQDYASDHTDS